MTDQEKEELFLSLYRQLGGRRKYEVRQYMKELAADEQRKKSDRGKVIEHDFTVPNEQ